MTRSILYTLNTSLLLWTSCLFLEAEIRTSTHYSVTSETIDGGGTSASSTHYASEGSVEVGPIATVVSSVYEIQHGFFAEEPLAQILLYNYIEEQFPGVTDPASVSLTSDDDGDFVPLILEYAYGLNPNVSDRLQLELDGLSLNTVGLPVVYLESIPGSVDFRAVFTRKVNFEAAGLRYTPQFSSNLSEWHNSQQSPQLLDVNAEGTIQLVSVPYPIVVANLNPGDSGLATPRFFRVSVELMLP